LDHFNPAHIEPERLPIEPRTTAEKCANEFFEKIMNERSEMIGQLKD
jgi:hypothetical protein